VSSLFQDKAVFILGVGSDIGARLAVMLVTRGARVVGTYRSEESVAELRALPEIRLIACDAANPESVQRAAAAYGDLGLPWDIFISCVGVLEPIGRFFSLNFDLWESSVRVNSLAQLRVLHALQPHRRAQSPNHAFFFAGGGTNSPFRNYSAYCLGKILLIKMCELLDDEDPSLNAVILGTGWVNTKIHRQTLVNPAAAEANYSRTREFLRAPEKGTSFEDIFACIEWCVRAGRELVGGRNFAIVHDAWREGTELLEQLRQDPNKFKLRRHGNT
jgi:NAD(P)-dependent dehydrogenase (short-subunit alcohol dehydrogenase family)